MFKKANFGLILLVMLLAITAFLMATSVTHNETGLMFEIPDDWSFDQEGDQFVATSSDESVFIYFFVGRFEDASLLMDNIADELDGIIDSPEITGEPYEEEINGLAQVYIEGSGYIEDEVIDFDLTLVIGGSKPMLVVALGDIDGFQDTIDMIYNSIQ